MKKYSTLNSILEEGAYTFSLKKKKKKSVRLGEQRAIWYLSFIWYFRKQMVEDLF